MATATATRVAFALATPWTRPRGRRASPARARGGRDASSSSTTAMKMMDDDARVVARLAPSARNGERRAEWRAAPSGREAATSRIARAETRAVAAFNVADDDE